MKVIIQILYHLNPHYLITIKLTLKKQKNFFYLVICWNLEITQEKLHNSIVPIINKTNIDKVYVKGKKCFWYI